MTDDPKPVVYDTPDDLEAALAVKAILYDRSEIITIPGKQWLLAIVHQYDGTIDFMSNPSGSKKLGRQVLKKALEAMGPEEEDLPEEKLPDISGADIEEETE